MKAEIMNKANSVTLKALVIAGLTLLMIIPVGMLESLIRERQEYQETVQYEIGSKWGGPQRIIGPVLVLPYEIRESGQTPQTFYAYFLPEELDVEGVISPEERSRTLYNVLVYQSQMELSGFFLFPDTDKLNLDPQSIRWQDASIYIGIPSLQGVKEKFLFQWNGEAFEEQNSVTNMDLGGPGLTVSVPLDPEQRCSSYPFLFDLSLNGTNNLSFAPVGKQTRVHLSSPWPTVSFEGNYLPGQRTVDERGFDARWNIFDFNRNFPQSWKGSRYQLAESTFGADLRLAVNHYQLSMRSVKYAILFIALTFLVFFLVELLCHRRIHPIQYLLVSLGLVLFYSLLLALSEHLGFVMAYGISAAAIIGLITAYSHSIFKNGRQTLMTGGVLTALYIYLYVMLQLENLALLFGSVGLFVALAVIMFVSRKVNWYKTSPETDKDDSSAPYPQQTEETSEEA